MSNVQESYPTATTGLGVAAQIVVAGNQVPAAKGAQYVTLSLTNNEWPSTFQLTPQIQDVAGNEVNLGTAFTLTSVAASLPAAYTLASVAASTSVGGVLQAVYTGTITGGASNAYIGREFVIAGFDLTANNGQFQCIASTATTLTLSNAAAVADTHAATAQDQTAVAVYTGTFTGTSSGSLVGQTFTVTGFDNAVNNGTFEATANNGSTTLTLNNPNAAADTHAATATAQETLVVQTMTAAAANGVYTGTFTQFAQFAAGSKVTIAGFDLAANNGLFTVVSVTSTTLTTSNTASVVDTHAATATFAATSVLTYFADGAGQYTGWNTSGPNTGPLTRAAVVAVSATGLLTAGAKGSSIVEVSFPFANNTIGATGASSPNPMAGLPTNKIYKEVNVTVVP